MAHADASPARCRPGARDAVVDGGQRFRPLARSRRPTGIQGRRRFGRLDVARFEESSPPSYAYVTDRPIELSATDHFLAEHPELPFVSLIVSTNAPRSSSRA